jgi:hypothetical protein
MRLMAEVDAAAVEFSIRYPSVAETELALAISSLAFAHEKPVKVPVNGDNLTIEKSPCWRPCSCLGRESGPSLYVHGTVPLIAYHDDAGIVGKGMQREVLAVRYRY